MNRQGDAPGMSTLWKQSKHLGKRAGLSPLLPSRHDVADGNTGHFNPIPLIALPVIKLLCLWLQLSLGSGKQEIDHPFAWERLMRFWTNQDQLFITLHLKSAAWLSLSQKVKECNSQFRVIEVGDQIIKVIFILGLHALGCDNTGEGFSPSPFWK